MSALFPEYCLTSEGRTSQARRPAPGEGARLLPQRWEQMGNAFFRRKSLRQKSLQQKPLRRKSFRQAAVAVILFRVPAEAQVPVRLLALTPILAEVSTRALARALAPAQLLLPAGLPALSLARLRPSLLARRPLPPPDTDPASAPESTDTGQPQKSSYPSPPRPKILPSPAGRPDLLEAPVHPFLAVRRRPEAESR